MYVMNFFASLGTAFDRIQGNAKPTQKEIASFRSGSSRCSLVKMTALVGVISSIAFALFAVIALNLLGMTFALVGAALLGSICYDVFVVAGRIQGVFDKAESRGLFHDEQYSNRYLRFSYLTEGTLFIRPIGQLSLRNSRI